MNQLRALLFPDWDLEALLMNVDPTREDEFSRVVSAIQTGQLTEAEEWLAIEIDKYPWVLLAAAYVKLKMNEPVEAGRLLRAVTLISSEARLRLWAWHSLRQLGKYPSPDLARQVLGVVTEVPAGTKTDILAAYADGTARYINHTGGMIVWDRLDETVTPLVLKVIREAQVSGEPQEDRPDEEIPTDQVRLSILTPGGIYAWQGAAMDHPSMGMVFASMAELLRALALAAMEQRRTEDPDEEE